jgi:hypothetical protein
MTDASERQRIEARLQQAAAGVDRRHVFWRLLGASPPWRLECSDAAVMQRLLAAVHDGCPGVRMTERLLPHASVGVSRAWVLSSVADVRRLPGHEAEQVTQALQGEILDVLLHEEGWLLVRLPDGYLGWMRDWHVTLCPAETPQRFGQRANARIRRSLVSVHETPHGGSCAEAILGTPVVRREEQRDWCGIELPGGREGWVPMEALRQGAGPWPCTVESIVVMLRGFTGVPYVWGGKSPKGFDCSGLVQFVYGLHGISLPRDSDQQFLQGRGVESYSPGDLLFFGGDRISHVGVSLGGSQFIHARGEVRCNGLVPGSPLHDPELAGILRGGRRVLTQPS